MSDERLRQLERRWKATGDAEDEAERLGERIRLGDLEPSKAALAAFCGYEAAANAIQVPPFEGRDIRPGQRLPSRVGLGRPSFERS